jgi:hypothetical protein
MVSVIMVLLFVFHETSIWHLITSEGVGLLVLFKQILEVTPTPSILQIQFSLMVSNMESFEVAADSRFGLNKSL